MYAYLHEFLPVHIHCACEIYFRGKKTCKQGNKLKPFLICCFWLLQLGGKVLRKKSFSLALCGRGYQKYSQWHGWHYTPWDLAQASEISRQIAFSYWRRKKCIKKCHLMHSIVVERYFLYGGPLIYFLTDNIHHGKPPCLFYSVYLSIQPLPILI